MKNRKLFKKNFSLMMDEISQLYSGDCIDVTCSTFSPIMPYITGLFSAIRTENAPHIGMKFYDKYPINNAKIFVTIRLMDTYKRLHTIHIVSEWELRGANLSYRNYAVYHDVWFHIQEAQLNVIKTENLQNNHIILLFNSFNVYLLGDFDHIIR